jgi:hypothetical protein
MGCSKMRVVDRLRFAAELSRGKRVLDIGGKWPFDQPPGNPFRKAYEPIAQAASQYEILDWNGGKYIADLSTRSGLASLADALRDYRPEVVLCMETLEHLKYPFELLDITSTWLLTGGECLFLTVPNNGNWVLNALGWHVTDHNFAFFGSTAMNMVRKSALGQCQIEMYACMQKYLWYWWLVYLIALGQPISWGFKVSANVAAPTFSGSRSCPRG